MKLHLDRWWENGLVFKIAKTKIHQISQHRYMILSSILTLLKKKNLSHLSRPSQGEGLEGQAPPPHFLKNKCGTSIQRRVKGLAKYVRYNEVFFYNLHRGSFSYCLTFYNYWSQKKNCSLDRGLRYRGSTVIYVFT